MSKITPFLWFDKEASEAAKQYISVFKNSRMISSTIMNDTPSGTVEIVSVELSGQEFTLMSAGPLFKFNPSVSFLVACKTGDEVDSIWDRLSGGGTALMDLGKYPFSERYGWVQDRFGLSWQIMHIGDRQIKQRITPTLMFVGSQCGRAEEAINFYTSVFDDARAGNILRYGKNEDPDKEGTVKHAAFTLEGQEFGAMDSAYKHAFSFNEAISFVVNCKDQAELDYYWGKLSHDPKSEQCGWLKDRFGLSWQVVPTILPRLLQDNDAEKRARVTKAMLQMKKIDINGLMRA
jgi:predicted 3-demethylubiquinone-9 3-methyltransferase (glyoxalase superfamily)